MKEEIYIIGCGGLAKEIYFLLRQVKKYNFAGFVEKQPKKSSIIIGNKKLKVIEEKKFLENHKKTKVIFGIGNPKLIKILSELYSNFEKPNIIHPSFICDYKNLSMGEGNIITAGVIFTTGIKIGSYNIFNLKTTVGHDTTIGDKNVFNPSTNISGNNKIGNENLFGVGSITLENIKINNNNIIGASALVTKNIEDNGVYVGIPAKLFKKN